MLSNGLEVALVVLEERLPVKISGIFIANVFGRRLLN